MIMPRAIPLALAMAISGIGIADRTVSAQSIDPHLTHAGNAVIPTDPYQGPHGHYDNAADFVRSLNGTPCGQECAQRAQERWGGARSSSGEQ